MRAMTYEQEAAVDAAWAVLTSMGYNAPGGHTTAEYRHHTYNVGRLAPYFLVAYRRGVSPWRRLVIRIPEMRQWMLDHGREHGSELVQRLGLSPVRQSRTFLRRAVRR